MRSIDKTQPWREQMRLRNVGSRRSENRHSGDRLAARRRRLLGGQLDDVLRVAVPDGLRRPSYRLVVDEPAWLRLENRDAG